MTATVIILPVNRIERQPETVAPQPVVLRDVKLTCSLSDDACRALDREARALGVSLDDYCAEILETAAGFGS